MNINEITVEQLEAAENAQREGTDPFAMGAEDSQLAKKILQTTLRVPVKVFSRSKTSPAIAIALGIRIGLILAEEASLCDENGVPNVVVEDQIAS